MSILRLAVALIGAGSAFAQKSPDGAALYAQHCARCHETGAGGWAFKRDLLSKLPSAAVLGNLHAGGMSGVATLTDDEKLAIASYLAGKPVEPFRRPPLPPVQGLCAGSAAADLLTGPQWNGWGVDPDNSRFQPAAGLSEEQIPRLKLKWAFGFPLAMVTWSQPAVAGDRIFVGSLNGRVYSLDARTGCTYWAYDASAPVRSAVSVGPGFGSARFAAYFGDLQANVHAVDALSGRLLWKFKADDHPHARVTGAPRLHEGRLYVPLASFEEVAGANPKYECCTFRGSVVALDARSGKQLWKTYMIPKAPRPAGRNAAKTQLWGPSGAGIWSAPTMDLKRKLLYVATGDHYSDPEEGYGDSVVALDMGTGKIVWGRKLLSGDRWNVGCFAVDKVGCPKNEGPDYDFGSSPILRSLPDGRRVLLAGQKSGVLHVLDPDRNGAIVRQVRVGKGGLLGGIEWGPAADAERAYVAISDYNPSVPEAGGGLTAIQIATGERLWHAPPPKPQCQDHLGCSAAQPGAVTAIPGAVFSGSLDGHIRAYSTADGKLLWDFDTRQTYQTVNGVPGQGGSLNAAGPTVINGMLYVNSGYGFLGGAPGNVLLAFSVDGK